MGVCLLLHGCVGKEALIRLRCNAKSLVSFVDSSKEYAAAQNLDQTYGCLQTLPVGSEPAREILSR